MYEFKEIDIFEEEGKLKKFFHVSWIRPFRNSRYAGVIPNNIFQLVMQETLKQLVSRGAKVLGAVNPNYPDQILGYICHEQTRAGEPVVHWVFVKDIYRRKGIAKELFKQIHLSYNEDFFFYTFKTRYSKYFPKGYFEPSIARRKEA